MKKHLKQTIKRISFDLIDRPSTVDRMEIDQDKIKELSENINEVGLLQPVLLRPIAGRFEIVAGDRRSLACRLLGLSDIDAVVRK